MKQMHPARMQLVSRQRHAPLTPKLLGVKDADHIVVVGSHDAGGARVPMKDVNAVRDAHLAGGDPFAAANGLSS